MRLGSASVDSKVEPHSESCRSLVLFACVNFLSRCSVAARNHSVRSANNFAASTRHREEDSRGLHCSTVSWLCHAQGEHSLLILHKTPMNICSFSIPKPHSHAATCFPTMHPVCQHTPSQSCSASKMVVNQSGRSLMISKSEISCQRSASNST